MKTIEETKIETQRERETKIQREGDKTRDKGKTENTIPFEK